MKANVVIRSLAWPAFDIADVAILTLLTPHPAELAAALRAPHAWVARVGADRAVATLAGGLLWLLACYGALALLAVLARTLPGLAGAVADRLARAVLPGVLYRAAAGATGLGMLLAPASTATAGAAPAPSPATQTWFAPAWPSDAPLPAPEWPADTDTAPTDTSTTEPPHRAHADRSVTVVPGDSLWSIAAARLRDPTDARVARAWPRWYATNRAVIGADPGLLQPGQVLYAPGRNP